MIAGLSLSPQPVPVLQPVRLTVTLEDTDGRPQAGRSVAFDLSMPSMTMAPNRPGVTESVPGTYVATALLPMAGEWRLAVEVSRPGRPAELTFTFTAD